jgi:hypothetical protein
MADRLPISNEVPREGVARDFNLIASTCLMWVLEADSLTRAFQLLVEAARADVQNERLEADVFRVPYLLGGLAIENLLKARIISRGQAAAKEGKLVLDTHDLPKLAAKGGVQLGGEEVVLMQRLQQFVQWGGRYPMPRVVDEMRPREFPDGSVQRLTDGFVLNDYAAIARFISKLRQEFPHVTYTLPKKTGGSASSDPGSLATTKT